MAEIKPDIDHITTNTTDYFLSFDNKTMEAVGTRDRWTYGSILVNYVGTNTAGTNAWRYRDGYEPGSAEFSLMLFLNSTSGDVASLWGAYAQELMLREFLRDESDVKSKVVQLDITLAPFPLSNNVNQFLAIFEGLFIVFGIGIAFILISMSMMSNIVKEKELNLKNQMRISGVSLPAYWIGLYISDIIFGAISTITMIILMAVYSIDCPGG